ncbi:MAG: hypothetical protein KatS3mg087_0227 [Patescibacteria group bacterium]|nr:MAG: hypothetical protein KatS3mg087_0227 [Patescibacteria group bacterium]
MGIIKQIINYDRPLTIIVFLTFCLYSVHSIVRHHLFLTAVLDLGIYSHIVWLYSQFQTTSVLLHYSPFVTHFEPILFFLAPLYRIFPSPITLLIIQALCVSLSGVFIYKIVTDLTHHKLLSYTILLNYYSAIGILFAINWEFHPETMAILPLSMLIYAWHFQKNKWLLALIPFMFLFKETMPFFTAGIGLLYISKKRIYLGITIIVFSILSFYIIKAFITSIPYPDGLTNQSDYYLNSSPIPISNPQKIPEFLLSLPHLVPQTLFGSELKNQNTLLLFTQYLYLPLLSPITYLIVIPYLFIRYSSSFINAWTYYFHYNVLLEPFLVLATTQVIVAILKNKVVSKWLQPKHLAIQLLLLATLKTIISPLFVFPSNILSLKEVTYAHEALKLLPPQASVCSQESIMVHIINRKNIHICLLDRYENFDYVILSRKLPPVRITESEMNTMFDNLQQNPDWEVIYDQNELYIFKKNNLK